MKKLFLNLFFMVMTCTTLQALEIDLSGVNEDQRSVFRVNGTTWSEFKGYNPLPSLASRNYILAKVESIGGDFEFTIGDTKYKAPENTTFILYLTLGSSSVGKFALESLLTLPDKLKFHDADDAIQLTFRDILNKFVHDHLINRQKAADINVAEADSIQVLIEKFNTAANR